MSLIKIETETFDGAVSKTIIEIDVKKMTIIENVVAIGIVILLVLNLFF